MLKFVEKSHLTLYNKTAITGKYNKDVKETKNENSGY